MSAYKVKMKDGSKYIIKMKGFRKGRINPRRTA